MFVSSFALLIALGTLGLKYLPGLYTGQPLSWLDAIFTATSAVCVTGLIVVDTATYFTFAGQAYLLLLIQLGGLGMIAFTSLIIIALGRRLSLRHESLSAGVAEVAPHVRPRRLILDVVRFTLSIEALGALALYMLWIPRFGWREAIWPAVFHSVSAFCNAGFSTFSDSMIGFQEAPVSLGVIMVLIVAGGLGFLTLEELLLHWKWRGKPHTFRMTLHSRVVLATTGALLLLGWVLFTVFEWDNTFVDMGLPGRLINGLFLSVTARTAGFNTVDYGLATESTNFLTILLMTVGGSPGSTAGGIKTTTFALIGLLAWSRFRGDQITNIWSRSVREETIQRAVGVLVVSSGVVVAGVFFLTASETHTQEEHGFLEHVFESVSAFNTVGLSMGITSTLSLPGKWSTILLMFFGRVGPLTLAAALARRARTEDFRYAYEEVVVG